MAPQREDLVPARAENLGFQITLFDHITSTSWTGQVELSGLSVRVPEQWFGSYLVVLRGTDGSGTPVVSFHSATGFSEALAGAAQRMSNGKLTWREDEFRKNG